MQELLIASNNQGKVKEIKEYLSSLPLKIYSLREWQLRQGLSDVPDPEEIGSSYQENALIKAQECWDWAKIPCLADDSGLEVVALGNEPGLYTARYAGVHATFDDNIAKLLQEMEGKANRQAVFKACLAFVDGQAQEFFTGELPGEITLARQGQGGFGYDPIFCPSGEVLTLAEVKGDYCFPTHRVRALEKFKEFVLASMLHKAQ